jgi:hypothetical protein
LHMDRKICITAQTSDLDSPTELRFARAPYFILVAHETDEWEALENELAQGSGGSRTPSSANTCC